MEEKVLLVCGIHSLTSRLAPRLSVPVGFLKVTFSFLPCFFKAGTFLKKPLIYICFTLETKVKKVLCK